MTFVQPADKITLSGPGQWVRVLTEDGQGAMMTCPDGHPLELCSYEIDGAGRVYPDVSCSACGFNDSVTLLGWKTLA